MRFGERFAEIATDWDRWPASVTWSDDGTALIVTADEAAAARCSPSTRSTSAVTRLTDDDFSYTDVRTAPGGVLYALRSSLRDAAAPRAHRSRRHRDGAAVRRDARAARRT